MCREGHQTGSKFLAMFGDIFQKDFKFYTFNSNPTRYKSQPDFIPAGIQDVTEKFKFLRLDGPNWLARRIKEGIVCDGGTELLEAMKWTIQNNPKMDLFIIITDEVTWADNETINSYKRMIPDELAGKVLLINVQPKQKSVFKPSEKIIRISGLDGKIIKMIESITDFDSFKKSIIEQFESQIN